MTDAKPRPPMEKPPFEIPAPLSASRPLTADEQQIQNALAKYAAAFKSRSYDDIDQAIADDFTLVQGGGAELTAAWSNEEFRKTQFKHVVDMFEDVHYEIDLLRGEYAGESATALFRFSVGGKMHGRAVSMDGIGTAILTAKGGELRVSHMHNSAQLSVRPAG